MAQDSKPWSICSIHMMTSDENTHAYFRKLLSLSNLPPEHIGLIFEKIQEKIAAQPLQEFTSYITSTLLENPLWTILSSYLRESYPPIMILKDGTNAWTKRPVTIPYEDTK